MHMNLCSRMHMCTLQNTDLLKFYFCPGAYPDTEKQRHRTVQRPLEIAPISDKIFDSKMLILWKLIVETNVSIS